MSVYIRVLHGNGSGIIPWNPAGFPRDRDYIFLKSCGNSGNGGLFSSNPATAGIKSYGLSHELQPKWRVRATWLIDRLQIEVSIILSHHCCQITILPLSPPQTDDTETDRIQRPGRLVFQLSVDNPHCADSSWCRKITG